MCMDDRRSDWPALMKQKRIWRGIDAPDALKSDAISIVIVTDPVLATLAVVVSCVWQQFGA